MFKLGFFIFIGFLSAYAERPTSGTVAYRQEHGQIPHDLGDYDVLLSISNCGLIGHEGVMQVGEIEYTAIVFDCGGAGIDVGHNWMLQNAIAAEVDYHFWMEHPELVGTGLEVEIEIEEIGLMIGDPQ